MNRSSVIIVSLGVLAIISIAGWYAKPGGLLTETLSGSTSPHLFLFPIDEGPSQAVATPAREEQLRDYNIEINYATTSSSTPEVPHLPYDPTTGPGSPEDEITVAPIPSQVTQTKPLQEETPSHTSSKGSLSATLAASPTLVRADSSVMLTWASQNAATCTLTGTNGDKWITLQSSGTQSSPIRSQTTFTLVCKGNGEENPSSISRSVKVFLAPSFSE